jgi:16S rRNA U516 pseudouridylate synthase RsuA-like enzyme
LEFSIRANWTHRRGTPRNAAEVLLGKDGRDAERVTTTLSRAQKRELDRLAEQQGVKVAWLVRRSVEAYLDEARGGPLLPLEIRQHAQR